MTAKTPAKGERDNQGWVTFGHFGEKPIVRVNFSDILRCSQKAGFNVQWNLMIENTI